MSERTPGTPHDTAPNPLERSAAPESPEWEIYNATVGRLVDRYLGKTYTIDGDQYTVWFARPDGGINEGNIGISELDLHSENGDVIEGISAKDLAGRIDSDNEDPANTEQAEFAQSSEHPESQGEDQPTAGELAAREQYALKDGPYHVRKTFTVGDHTYTIDGIYYSGAPGNFATDAIDVLDTTTGQVMPQLTVPEFEAILAKEAQEFLIKQRVEQELESFDENTTMERAQFEAFLYEHPELLEDDTMSDDGKENEVSQTSPAPTSQAATIDAIENTELTDAAVVQKEADAIAAFNKLAMLDEDYEKLRDEFMHDLEAYLDGLRPTSSPDNDNLAA